MQEQTVTEAELRELVRRDLTWLFNTTHIAANTDLASYPHVERSVLNFGIMDLTGHTLSSIRIELLQQHVLEVLQRYEPRVNRDSITIDVRVGSNPFGVSALIIEIRGELWAEPLPLTLHLRTEVDVETGRVTVDELETERSG